MPGVLLFGAGMMITAIWSRTQLRINRDQINLEAIKIMRLRHFRTPAALLAFVMFSMAACDLLQAQSEPEHSPSCHGKSEPSPERKSDSGIKYCCEAGLIPNTNKSPIYMNTSSTVVLEKFQCFEESCHAILSPFDILVAVFPTGPTSVSLISPLRI